MSLERKLKLVAEIDYKLLNLYIFNELCRGPEGL